MRVTAEPETLTNSHIAELLAREAERAQMPAQKALRRGSRRALFWPEEAAALVEQGRSLTELPAVGPYLAKLIAGWIEKLPCHCTISTAVVNRSSTSIVNSFRCGIGYASSFRKSSDDPMLADRIGISALKDVQRQARVLQYFECRLRIEQASASKG